MKPDCLGQMHGELLAHLAVEGHARAGVGVGGRGKVGTNVDEPGGG